MLIILSWLVGRSQIKLILSSKLIKLNAIISQIARVNFRLREIWLNIEGKSMTQELMDLKTSILEGRYADALLIVDELEGMSKQAILRNIKAFVKILLIHLIKNQVEQRLTGSWASSIRNSVQEIQDLNLKGNKNSYYINNDEWEDFIESVLMAAIADASEEVSNGIYNEFELADSIDRVQLIEVTLALLNLTYQHSAKDLPVILGDYLLQLPGGEDWRNKRK